MPQVAVLKRNLERAVDDNLSLPDALDYLNAAQRDLAVAAKIPATVILPFTTADLSKNLPSDLIELRELTVEFDGGLGSYLMSLLSPKNNLRTEDNRTIQWDTAFEYTGRFVVRYHRMPITMTDPSEVPEIPEQFHDALVHHAADAYFVADDELLMAADHQKKYMTKKLELMAYGDKKGPTGQPVKMDSRPPWARR